MKSTKDKKSSQKIVNSLLDLSKKDSKIITDHLASNDKVLAGVIKAVGPFHIERNEDRTTFDALVRSIIYQQLNGKAASSIYKRFIELFGGLEDSRPEKIMAIDDETIRMAGVSRPKLRAIRSLCEHQIAGLIPEETEIQSLSDEEIIEKLTQVKGIGVWTAQMILMFHLGRPDVLPVLDYGVKKGFQLVFYPKLKTLPEVSKLERRAKKWKPYRSVASWYMWRIQDIELPD